MKEVSEAPRPVLGSNVIEVATGRTAVVEKYDPDDPSLAYKIKFDDGASDWCAQDAVAAVTSKANNSEATPLCIGHAEIVKQLVGARALVDKANVRGFTPLHQGSSIRTTQDRQPAF